MNQDQLVEDSPSHSEENSPEKTNKRFNSFSENDDNRQTLKLDGKEYKKAGILRQIGLLVKKNFKVILGKPGFMFSHLFTTVLVCGVILLINYLTRFSYENEPSMVYPVYEVGNIEKCKFSGNCKSLGYIIIVRLSFIYLFRVKSYLGQNIQLSILLIRVD